VFLPRECPMVHPLLRAQQMPPKLRRLEQPQATLGTRKGDFGSTQATRLPFNGLMDLAL